MQVLVVDDDEDIRLVLELYLLQHVTDVTAAGNAATARERCREQQFDLAFVDVTLPDAHGPDLVRELADTGRLPTRVVLLSGTQREELAGFASELDVASVAKPFTLDQLDAVVGPMLEPDATDDATDEHDRTGRAEWTESS